MKEKKTKQKLTKLSVYLKKFYSNCTQNLSNNIKLNIQSKPKTLKKRIESEKIFGTEK